MNEELKLDDEKAFHYPFLFQGGGYKKLLAIQTKPSKSYWFKDIEYTESEFMKLLISLSTEK
jgi:hypothetical protein